MIEARNARAGPDRVYRLAYVVSHPIQYQAPLLRLIARQADIDLHVYFLSDLSGGGYFDPGFGRWIEWDVPLTAEYAHTFLARGDRASLGTRLFRELRRARYDAVWIHGYARTGTLLALAAAKKSGARVLLRGESHLGLRKNHFLRRALLRRFFSMTDGFLAIGSLNAAFYSHHGVREDDIYLVPYAVDNEFFARAAMEAAQARESLRVELGMEPNSPVILFASRMTAAKGPDVLLDSFLGLDVTPAPYLIFIGDGDQRAALESAAEGHERIRFLGFRNQTELPRYYDLCDVLVLPSRWEPWGLVINEAMNAGKPIVTTHSVGAAPDLVHEGINGSVLEAGDSSALRAALRKLCSDPSLARQQGRESLRIISTWGFDADLEGLRHALSGGKP